MIVDQMVIDYVDYVRSGFVDDAVFDEFLTGDPPRPRPDHPRSQKWRR